MCAADKLVDFPCLCFFRYKLRIRQLLMVSLRGTNKRVQHVMWCTTHVNVEYFQPCLDYHISHRRI